MREVEPVTSGMMIGLYGPKSGGIPGDLLVIDPQGRRVGRDARTGTEFTEIPGSHYGGGGLTDLASGALVNPSKEVDLPNLTPGEYRLVVTGTGTCDCELVISTHEQAREPIEETLKLRLDANRVFEYSIAYSSKGATIRPK